MLMNAALVSDEQGTTCAVARADALTSCASMLQLYCDNSQGNPQNPTHPLLYYEHDFSMSTPTPTPP